MTTYTTRNAEGTRSREMAEAIRSHGNDPVFVGADATGNELYQFADTTEVVVTNAGLVTDGADGWAELRAGIVSA